MIHRWGPKGRYNVSLLLIVALRTLFYALLAATLDALLGLGSNLILIYAGLALATVLSTKAALSTLRSVPFLVLTALPWLLLEAAVAVGAAWDQSTPAAVMRPYIWQQQGQLLLAFATLAALSTWGFWRWPRTLIIELIAAILFVLQLFTGHRFYRFDLVQFVNTLAWNWGVSDLVVLVSIGAFLAVGSLVFLWSLDYFKPATAAEDLSPPPRLWLETVIRLLSLAALAVLVLLLSWMLYRYHWQQSSSRMARGVGQESREGLSPLGFHSALGNSKQPSAVVRLEGDYKKNPFSPMLYLREAALSTLKDHELVIAPRDFDQDVSRSGPHESFDQGDALSAGDADPWRQEVVQSVYLLAQHDLAFAIDYPRTIRSLRLPAQVRRFKDAYRAYSQAPTFALGELTGTELGDPAWSSAVSEHYRQPHPDPRYAELARRITAPYPNDLDKVLAVTRFLSKQAIYSLAPEHQVPPGGDPVAAFLFGDLRGYCVHFAHAAVYLLRAVGIPARIGTGYLTDLSQSRDGHILLRMSDRHAWPEVFVHPIGWIPFDIQPEQVESHAESPVDQQLLEELMSLLDPGEELRPHDLLADEPAFQPHAMAWLPRRSDLLLLLAAVLLTLYGFKGYLRLAWRLPTARATLKCARLYQATAALLYDSGWGRRRGETRQEFQKRLADDFGPGVLPSAALLDRSVFAARRVEAYEIAAAYGAQRRVFSKLNWRRKLLSWINLASVFNRLGGWRW